MSEFMGKDPELELIYDKSDDELLEMAEKAYKDNKTLQPELSDNEPVDEGDISVNDTICESNDILEDYDISIVEKSKKKVAFTSPGDRVILGIASGIVAGSLLGFISVKPVYFIVGGILLGLILGSISDFRCCKRDNN